MYFGTLPEIFSDKNSEIIVESYSVGLEKI